MDVTNGRVSACPTAVTRFFLHNLVLSLLQIAVRASGCALRQAEGLDSVVGKILPMSFSLPVDLSPGCPPTIQPWTIGGHGLRTRAGAERATMH